MQRPVARCISQIYCGTRWKRTGEDRDNVCPISVCHKPNTRQFHHSFNAAL